MRWVRFSKDGVTSYGSLDGDAIAEIRGEPWAAQGPTGRTLRLSDVKLEVPVIRAPSIAPASTMPPNSGNGT